MRKKVLLLMVAVAMILGQLHAQAPYKHSVGGMVGSLNGFTYKTFVSNHFAIGVDLGVQFIRTDGEYFRGVDLYSLSLNPNFTYEGLFAAGLYGFVGGGFSMAYNWANDYGFLMWMAWDDFDWVCDLGKFGVNAIMGLEYKFNIPLVLQFDFRPGYGFLFNSTPRVWNHFDWNLCISVRYAF